MTCLSSKSSASLSTVSVRGQTSKGNGFPRGGRTLVSNLGPVLAGEWGISVGKVSEGEALPEQSVMRLESVDS